MSRSTRTWRRAIKPEGGDPQGDFFTRASYEAAVVIPVRQARKLANELGVPVEVVYINYADDDPAWIVEQRYYPGRIGEPPTAHLRRVAEAAFALDPGARPNGPELAA